MPFLILWGAWVGAAWVIVAALLMFAATRRYRRLDLGPATHSLLSRAGAGRLVGGAALGLLVLWVVGANAMAATHRAEGTSGASVLMEESLEVQLGACSPFQRASILSAMAFNYMGYAPATKTVARRSITLANLRHGCSGVRNVAGRRWLSVPMLADCSNPGYPDALAYCEPDSLDFTGLMLAGDEERAVLAARRSMQVTQGVEQRLARAELDRRWECVALGLEARVSGSLEALRAVDDPNCRLVMATMVPRAEVASLLDQVPSVLDPDTPHFEQGLLAFTILAAASPAEAARRFYPRWTREWFEPAAGWFARYEPGAAAALRSVEAVNVKDGTMTLLQATMQAGVGLNAFANVQLDEADAAFERANALVAQAREKLEGERAAARAQLMELPVSGDPRLLPMMLDLRSGRPVDSERSLAQLPVNPSTPSERALYALLRSSLRLRMTVGLEHRVGGWRALLALVERGETPSSEFVGGSRFTHELLHYPEVFASPAPRWSLYPGLPDDDPSLRRAIASGDGEQIAMALGNLDFGDRAERFSAAFATAAGTHTSVLSNHLRYGVAFVSCSGELRWEQLNEHLLLAHILHDDAWIEALRERQSQLNAHLDDLLLHVPAAFW